MARPVGSGRLRGLPTYAFAEIESRAAALRERGVDVIDFGVGDPTAPTPERVREAARAAVDRHAEAGYPVYAGSIDFRRAAADWIRRRFGADVDPDREVSATIGSKEAIFHLAKALLDPGDVAIVPSPGYPPYARGAEFAEAAPHAYGLLPENDFLPDLDSIPADVLSRARLLWVNYPNSPTGACATADDLRRVAEFARRHDLIVASDEAYVDIWFDRPAPSMLEVARERTLSFFSLSKRSNMTGYRVGFVAGDAEVVGALRRMKTNIDSGTPNFVQDAAIEALSDESHVARMRDSYRRKRDVLCGAFESPGLQVRRPAGTVFVWLRLPEGAGDVEVARRLLEPDVACVATPGSLIAQPLADGRNPGAGHLRFALVPPEERVREAAARIARIGTKGWTA
ncbi:MAG: aminotransferase class I/II-fold pyridoxal phosphate-dependent enzyme [Myxococcota bacterium]|nr:aminotransferase class I/II-fold pyridoxal phosphate-dependent enzyme [Myxococcota bacterium]